MPRGSSWIACADFNLDGYPDLLALSFSALDYVGHEWGPNSPEALDVVLRLDRALGDLLAFLDRAVGEGAVVVALSSDHGAAPLPELAAALGVPARRAGARTCSASSARTSSWGGPPGMLALGP